VKITDYLIKLAEIKVAVTQGTGNGGEFGEEFMLSWGKDTTVGEGWGGGAMNQFQIIRACLDLTTLIDRYLPAFGAYRLAYEIRLYCRVVVSNVVCNSEKLLHQ
jgi:hypothetical protein